MTTIDVSITYTVPDLPLHETVKAEAVWGDEWELREHTGFAPLAPGDHVRVNAASELVEIVSTVPTFVYTVSCHLPAGISFGMSPTPDHPAMVAMAQVEEAWRRDTWVTRTTAFTFVISSPTRYWFEETVAPHPYVEEVELIRTPTMRFDLREILAHPHFGQMEI